MASPPPGYDFERLPLVRGRDPFWVEKRDGDGRMLPAPADPHREAEGVRMPALDATPALLALGMTLFAHGALYRMTCLMAAAGAIAAGALYVYMWRPEREEILPFQSGPQRRPA